MLFYHSPFKDTSRDLKGGSENHIMWFEIQKRFPGHMLNNNIYCNPIIVYNKYLASIYSGYHYFVFHRILVKLLAIFKNNLTYRSGSI